MAGKRKVHTAAFKAQVALAAIKGDHTINELAGHELRRPTPPDPRLEEAAHQRCGGGLREPGQGELFEQIGRLKMELEWLKTNVAPFG